MIKKLLSVIGLLCCTWGANAAVQYMTVELNSAEKFSFLLADNPVVTYANGELHISSSLNASFAISKVMNFHFTENDQTDVTNYSSEILRVRNIDENTIGIENAKERTNIMLINANGKMVANLTTDDSGSASLPLPSQKGVYVLTIGNKSFKLIRK